MVTIGLTPPEGPQGAPLVVLGHSLGTGPLIWEQVGPMLQEEYRVSLLTLPGHGNVPVPTEAFTMDELTDSIADGIKQIDSGKVLYAGVSIGGALALNLALRHPDLFSGVVPMASMAAMGDAEHWNSRAAFVREQSTSALVADSSARWFAPSSIERQPVLSGRILHALADTPNEGYARCAEALGTYDVESQVGAISIPTLLIAGREDPVAPPEKVEELARRIPGAGFEVIEESGHQPPAEQAQQVYEVLVKFFRKVA